MPTFSFQYDTDAERLELERVTEMRQLGRTAAYGTVLDTLERFALDRGRALIRDNLAANFQARAAGEKKVPANAFAARASATWAVWVDLSHRTDRASLCDFPDSPSCSVCTVSMKRGSWKLDASERRGVRG